MRIGFYFECSTKSGGAYQYALNMLEVFKAIPEHEYVVFNISPDFPSDFTKLPNWKVVNLISIAKKETSVDVVATSNLAPDLSFRRQSNLFILNLLKRLHLYRLEIFLTSLNAKRRAKRFDGYEIDLMFYHGPSELSFLTKIPGVVPIHDIEHRLHKGEFPELSEKGQWAKREYLFKNIARKAWRIFVDSEVSKEDVSREYRADERKITIVPFVPAIYLRTNLRDDEKDAVKRKFNLPERFIYYPASLWPHKNHIGILKAIAQLKKAGKRIDVVFSGSLSDQWGELGRLKSYIALNNLEDQVHFLGFVNADEISALYSTAEALIMPVLMGPTYIPVYEAWYMGCPVIYSDIRGPREQAGNAALLVNPQDPSDIAEKIKNIWGNEGLKSDLVTKGKKRLSSWTWNDFCTSIKRTIDAFQKEQR